jgi:sulfopropanediol 3-dehydrogenase
MLVIKEGGHRLFETDPETSRTVADLLADLRRRGLDAVRDLSRRFDGWDPPSFELSEAHIQVSPSPPAGNS